MSNVQRQERLLLGQTCFAERRLQSFPCCSVVLPALRSVFWRLFGGPEWTPGRAFRSGLVKACLKRTDIVSAYERWPEPVLEIILAEGNSHIVLGTHFLVALYTCWAQCSDLRHGRDQVVKCSYVLAEVRCLTKGSFSPRSGAEPCLLRVQNRKYCDAGTDSRVSRYDVGGRWWETDSTRTVSESWYEDLHCKH